MSEECPHCGKRFANTKALGSHIHYMHSNIYKQEYRSELDQERFERLLVYCCSEAGLKKPYDFPKLEQAIAEIPDGICLSLDRYREPYRSALDKLKLGKEMEKIIGDVERVKTD